MSARAKDFLFDMKNMRNICASEDRMIELIESYFKMKEKTAYNQALIDLKDHAEKLRY